MYQVLRKLSKGADKILEFMGYKPTSQELKYEGDVNIERVLETAADLVILHSELDLIKELVDTAIHESQSDTRVANFVTLHKILDARAGSDEKYEDTWKRLMKAAYAPPQDANNQLSQSSNLQSGRPTSDITAYGQFLDAKQDARRGSSPALNQWSDIQTTGLGQDLDLRRGSVPVLNSSVGHHHNMPLGTAATSSGDCKHVQSTHQSQLPSSDSLSHYQNVPYAQATASSSETECSRGEDLYENISQTAVGSNQGAPTGQSSTAGHQQRSPQEAKVIHIRGTTPAKVHTSVSSRSFQEDLRKLYQQFPDLASLVPDTPDPVVQTSPSSHGYDMPSPQEIVVGQTELADPVVEGFWYCTYCTNLVSNTMRVCDACGCDIDAFV